MLLLKITKLTGLADWIVSCLLLKHLTRKIKSNLFRHFDVSNIIIKNGKNVNVKVVKIQCS